MAGKMVDDHSSWVGKGGDGEIFPIGVKLKKETSAEGAGGITTYEDTTERVKYSQVMGKNKIKSHPMIPGTRN